jgi:hypothetical protein
MAAKDDLPSDTRKFSALALHLKHAEKKPQIYPFIYYIKEKEKLKLFLKLKKIKIKKGPGHQALRSKKNNNKKALCSPKIAELSSSATAILPAGSR